MKPTKSEPRSSTRAAADVPEKDEKLWRGWMWGSVLEDLDCGLEPCHCGECDPDEEE